MVCSFVGDAWTKVRLQVQSFAIMHKKNVNCRNFFYVALPNHQNEIRRHTLQHFTRTWNRSSLKIVANVAIVRRRWFVPDRRASFREFWLVYFNATPLTTSRWEIINGQWSKNIESVTHRNCHEVPWIYVVICFGNETVGRTLTPWFPQVRAQSRGLRFSLETDLTLIINCNVLIYLSDTFELLTNKKTSITVRKILTN